MRLPAQAARIKWFSNLINKLKKLYNEKEFTVHNDTGISGSMEPEFSIRTKQIIMDKKLIQQYGEEILCYRIRSARQKKRMRYEDFDKQLIQIYKEEHFLWISRNKLGWEPLVPPVQKGWKRFFVLRDDVARGKNADFFAAILKKINTYDWSHRKDFMVKKRRFGRKKYVVKGQNLLQPNEVHFRKLEFTDAEKQFFHEELSYEPWKKDYVKRYVFNEPWRFVLRVRPNIITKVKKRDHEIESRLQQIDNYMERNNYRPRMEKLVYGWVYDRFKHFEFYKGYTPFHNSVHTILNQLVRDKKNMDDDESSKELP